MLEMPVHFDYTSWQLGIIMQGWSMQLGLCYRVLVVHFDQTTSSTNMTLFDPWS